MTSKYDRVMMGFSRINLACAILGACVIFAIVSFVFFEVASRYLFGTSRLWVIEVSEYSLLFMTFLGAPYLLEKNRHVVIDIVYENLSPGPKLLATLFNATLGLLICAALTYVGLTVVADQIDTGVRETTVMMPKSWWISWCFPLSMALMAVQFLDKIVRTLTAVEER